MNRRNLTHTENLGNAREADAKLQWESIDNSVYQLDGDTLLVCEPACTHFACSVFDALCLASPSSR